MLSASDLNETAEELVESIRRQNRITSRTLEQMAGEQEPKIPELFQVVVQCEDETQQRRLFDSLTGKGFSCKLLTT